VIAADTRSGDAARYPALGLAGSTWIMRIAVGSGENHVSAGRA